MARTSYPYALRERHGVRDEQIKAALEAMTKTERCRFLLLVLRRLRKKAARWEK